MVSTSYIWGNTTKPTLIIRKTTATDLHNDYNFGITIK